jgi:hypothetical protein
MDLLEENTMLALEDLHTLYYEKWSTYQRINARNDEDYEELKKLYLIQEDLFIKYCNTAKFPVCESKLILWMIKEDMNYVRYEVQDILNL